MIYTQETCPYHHMTIKPVRMTERGSMAIVYSKRLKCWRIQSGTAMSKPIKYCPFCRAKLGGDPNDG